MKDASVKKHVGHELPDKQIVCDARRNKPQERNQELASRQLFRQLQQKDRHIRNDEHFDRGRGRAAEQDAR